MWGYDEAEKPQNRAFLECKCVGQFVGDVEELRLDNKAASAIYFTSATGLLPCDFFP